MLAAIISLLALAALLVWGCVSCSGLPTSVSGFATVLKTGKSRFRWLLPFIMPIIYGGFFLSGVEVGNPNFSFLLFLPLAAALVYFVMLIQAFRDIKFNERGLFISELSTALLLLSWSALNLWPVALACVAFSFLAALKWRKEWLLLLDLAAWFSAFATLCNLYSLQSV